MSQKQVTLSIIPENTQIILIGASEFEDKDKLLPLPSVKNNVDALKQLFVNSEIMGIPKDNVTVILDKLYDAEIWPLLETPIKKALDTLVIYYAGHGVPYNNQVLYLATQRTVFSKPQRTGALSFSQILDAAIHESSAGKIILILDCCYSGLAIQEKCNSKGKKIFILTATATTIKAKAPPDETYTAFTNEFLQLLNKGINNNKEALILGKISEELKNQLVEKNFPKPQQVSFNDAHNLKIAYNCAYQPSTQNEKKTTILFLSADSNHITRSRLKKEMQEIDTSLQKATNKNSFEFHEATLERVGELTQAIHDKKPQILHFAGYGKSTGELCLENEDGEIHEIHPDALAPLFELIANQVRCVILSACYSEIQAKVIAKHIDYVIGMSGEISDDAAIAFAAGFYKALGGGHLFEEAYKFGIAETGLEKQKLSPVILGKKIPEQKSGESEPNISTLVIPLSDFLDRLVSEGPHGIPFTWLIGAGMSVTSGIPLAKDISYRIILFEYLMRKKRVRPWAPDDKKRITYETDLTNFFKWYETTGQEASLVELRWNSINWLKNEEKYKEISLEDPKSYQWLFQNVFLSPTIHHAFLTNLVNRTKGVNLAHLGLAGLLRDHREWGHTVFTTNFDDLLLKALLSLNHTARVFGDLQSKDTPHTKPDYPQIVHLHGRHTGYRLRNTQEQISLIDPELLDGFTKHLADSHLIVLGYSGWDELVINALKEWPKQHDLIKGNLIWVPYQTEETLLPQIQEFLNSCPPGRVHVITNEKRPLDADFFILSLCDMLNEDNGGFVPYRKGIIDHAKHQHSFVLQQLEDYHPDFAPSQALNNIIAAKESLKNYDVEKAKRVKKAEELKESAKDLIEADDIPDKLRGKVFLEIGIVELLLGNTDNSEQYLQKALLIWDKIKASYDKSPVEKANTLRALGELNLKLGYLEEARGYLIGAIRRYDRVCENSGIGYTKKLLSDISMREGKIERATELLKESLNAFNTADDVYGKGICLRSLGDIYRIDDNRKLAIENYENANALFTKINNRQGIANTFKGMASIYIKNGDYEKAEETINDAIALYEDLGDGLGIANMENSLGDLYLQQNDIQNAIRQYKKSANYYRDVGAKHGLSNALADILVCLSKSSEIDHTDNKFRQIRQKLFEVLEGCKNAYASNITKKSFHNFAKQNTDDNNQTERSNTDNEEINL